MQKDIFDRVISFLFGASWGLTLFGAFVIFKTFLFLGLSFSLFLTIFYVFIILMLILTLDSFSINRKRLEESRKQTELLEKLTQH